MISDEDICVWSDDTWCYGEELEGMNHLSDDFKVLSVDSVEYDLFIKDVENAFSNATKIVRMGNDRIPE